TEPIAERPQRRLGGGLRREATADVLERGAHEPEPDDRLARARRRAGAERVVGIGAGADHRRVADAAGALPGDAARRGGGGDVPARIAGDRADGLAGGRAPLAPAAPGRRGHERARGADRQPVAAGARASRTGFGTPRTAPTAPAASDSPAITDASSSTTPSSQSTAPRP